MLTCAPKYRRRKQFLFQALRTRQRTSVKRKEGDITYFMNEGCQRLLVAAAAADQEAADGSPSTIGLHRQTVRQEQPSCTTDRKGEL